MPELTTEQKAELLARVEKVKSELVSLCKEHEVAIIPITDIVDGRIVASIVIKDTKYLPKKEEKKEEKPTETKE